MSLLHVNDLFFIEKTGFVLVGTSTGSFNAGEKVKIISRDFEIDTIICSIEKNGELADYCQDGDMVGLMFRGSFEYEESIHRYEIFGIDFEHLLYGMIVASGDEDTSDVKLKIKELYALDAVFDFNEVVTLKTGKYKDVLIRKRAQLVYVDEYGDEIFEDFEKEMVKFCSKKLGYGGSALESASKIVVDLITYMSREGDAAPNDIISSESISPYEYEKIVASLLRELGWESINTKGSGDQGADVISEKNGIRLVVQCKYYSGLVGNKAVQEAFAAKGYYGASFAAVVSNNEFSKSAKQLAHSLGVLLLHHEQLASVDHYVFDNNENSFVSE